jgi:hypothetical protein
MGVPLVRREAMLVGAGFGAALGLTLAVFVVAQRLGLRALARLGE